MNFRKTRFSLFPERIKFSLNASFSMLAIVLAILMSLSGPREARADSGYTFLEAMGISVAVGTVLGASTLPFYEQPGRHVTNLAVGAAIGAIVGLGAVVFGATSGGNSRPDLSAENFLIVQRQVALLESDALVWMPVVSLSW